MIFKNFSRFSIPQKIFTVLFMILFILACILAVIHVRSRMGFGIGTWFPLLYFFLLTAVTYNFHRLKKICKPVIYIFYAGMSAFCGTFIIFCVLITGYTSQDIPDDPDLVIVLGCQVIGYSPGNLLRYRLESSIEILNKYPETSCIVSGGQGPDELIPESQAMKKYLADKNISGNRILEENKSSTTFENLLFSKKIIAQNGLANKNMIIVTSEYHIPRAMMLAGRIFDNSQIYAVQSETPFALFSAGITREFFAFVKSFIFDKE